MGVGCTAAVNTFLTGGFVINMFRPTLLLSSNSVRLPGLGRLGLEPHPRPHRHRACLARRLTPKVAATLALLACAGHPIQLGPNTPRQRPSTQVGRRPQASGKACAAGAQPDHPGNPWFTPGGQGNLVNTNLTKMTKPHDFKDIRMITRVQSPRFHPLCPAADRPAQRPVARQPVSR